MKLRAVLYVLLFLLALWLAGDRVEAPISQPCPDVVEVMR